MAHPTGTSARVQRLTSLVAILAVAVASGLAFGRIFEGRRTTATMILVGVLSAALAWAFERRSLLLATAVSTVALIFAVTWLVFPETTWYGLPSLDTLRAIGDAAAQVGEEARVRVSPTEPVDPLVMASLVGVWAAVFSCHALAFRAGSPLLALVPPIALIVFADSVLDEVVRPVYGIIFLVAGLAVVFADALRRLNGWGPIWTGPSRTTRLLPTTGRGARRIAATAVVVAAAAPFLMPGFGSKAVLDISAVNRDDRINVSPLVSVAAQLQRDGEPTDVFEVETDRSSYWRMTALERFDGIEWTAGPDTEAAVSPEQELMPVGAEPATATFTVVNDVGYDWLPVGVYANSIGIDGPVTWSEETQTLRSDEPLDAGSTYTTTFSSLEPTEEDLRDEDFSRADPDPALIAVPEDGYTAQIREIAQDWTRGADSDFEKIMAIQARFNDAAEFQYRTEVNPREDSASLLEFLTVTRRGFCQQFASAMAVMLRTLGIPARVAIGYTAGDLIGSSRVRQVTTDELHVWVEVKFPGYGWLPFEPTPGRTNPSMSSYTLGSGPRDGSDDGCTRRLSRDPDCGATGTPTPAPPPPTRDPLDSPTSEGGATGGRGLGWPAIVALVVLGIAGLVAVAIPGRRAWRRRRLIRRAGDEPRRLILATYDVFADRAAELGIPRGVGETPREYATRVVQDGRVQDGRVRRLATLTTRAAYAPAAPTREDALDAVADAQVSLQEMTDSTPWRLRLMGRLRLH